MMGFLMKNKLIVVVLLIAVQVVMMNTDYIFSLFQG